MSLLQMKGITVRFPGVIALDNIDFEIEDNEIHCLVGHNGAGKSTLVKVLMGAYPYTGQIILDTREIKIDSPQYARTLGISAVQQERDLIPTLDLVENILLGNEYTNGIYIDRQKMCEKASELLSMFNVELDFNVPVREFTIAEQEIIAICKALSGKCRILMIDEASAPLDNDERQNLFNILKNIKKGVGIIYISHHIEEVFEIGDRVTVLRNGKNVGTKKVGEVDINDIISMMVGEEKELTGRLNTGGKKLGPESIRVEGITVKDLLIENISFSARQGEILAFTGLLGSNIDVMTETIFGLRRPIAGKIYINQEEVKIDSIENAVQKGIGLVPDSRREKGLILCRSVAENLNLAKINQEHKFFISMKEFKLTTEECIRKLGIILFTPEQRVEFLSGGNQQKVVFGKWMSTNPDILFLIQPTEGIDINAKADIYEFILKTTKEEGKTVIIITTDIEEIFIVADRVITMNKGKISGEFMVEKTSKAKILEQVLGVKKV